MTRAATSRGRVPWWLEPGDEQCEYCLAWYGHELELRCIGCDRAVCPFCVVIVREHIERYCPECKAAPVEA